jgi:hypothetical protein
MTRTTTTLFLGLGFALLTACGGGTSTPDPTPAPAPAPPPPPAVVATIPEGLWKGTVQASGKPPSSAYALVLGNGQIRIAEDNNYQFAATFDAGIAQGLAYAPAGQSFSYERQFIGATLYATAVTPGVSFSGTAVVDGNPGSFSFDQYFSGYDRPVTPADLAGTYTSAADANSTETVLTLNVTDYLVLNGSGTGGLTFSGLYAIPDPAKSAFKVVITQGTTGSGVTGWFGLGALDRSATGAPQLYLATDGGLNGTFSARFTKNGPGLNP